MQTEQDGFFTYAERLLSVLQQSDSAIFGLTGTPNVRYIFGFDIDAAVDVQRRIIAHHGAS